MDDFCRLVAQVTPRQVECGNETTEAKGTYTTQPRAVALRAFTHYRTSTDTWLPVLQIDNDGRDPFDRIMAGEQFPFPTWLVYNTVSGHAHSIYALAEPVNPGPTGRPRPRNTAALVRAALTLRLEGDPSHRNTVARTPWHAQHTFFPVLFKRWNLRELLALLSEEADEAMRQRQQRRTSSQLAAGANGRNDDLYLTTVRWAMDEARAGRWGTLDYASIHAAAVSFNTYTPPLPAGEVRTITRSALGFMQRDWWGNRSATPGSGTGSPRERLRSWHRDPITPQEARERQQAGAAQTAAGKTAATRAAISVAADSIRQSGQQPTSKAVAAVTGLSVRTVKTHSDLYR
ncbi:replication initiation protein [Deinococcus sp. RIT780]|uniref:replication initiation protein n=1 Tax=Deinococcus sp. RIT780 TaxID=2870472 RepID=UPI001C89E372|nr:replication initiation protein [Deinococcus sp. RIT780]MBX8466584.1 replication initiation protein [Deinococcus sp. RIT780]